MSEERIDFEGIAEVYALGGGQPHYLMTTLGALRQLLQSLSGEMRDDIQVLVDSGLPNNVVVQISDNKVKILVDE